MSTHFVAVGLISLSDKVKAVSQYRSFVSILPSGTSLNYDDWIQFLVTHYEVQCRPELLQLFRLSCLCLASLQILYQSVPHVSSLFRDARAIGRVFRLLGRGTELLTDKKLSIWNFLKGSTSRRRTLQGRLETGYRKAVLRLEKPTVTSSPTTPSVSRTSSVNSTPSPDLSSGRINVLLSR